MKKLTGSPPLLPIVLLVAWTSVSNAQNPVPADTSAAAKQEVNKKSEEENKKEKRKATYIIYAGPNFNMLNDAGNQFTSVTTVGYHLGFSYRSNGFLYWQAGARFNSAAYQLTPVVGFTDSLDNKFSVSDLDIPITGGINFLSMTNRVLNIRAFISVVPAFVLNVSDNDIPITKDDIHTFNFYGQGGVGLDVLFLVIEGGFNYGFGDLLTSERSNPGQVFINLGFRF